jgi:hypothetical protein
MFGPGALRAPAAEKTSTSAQMGPFAPGNPALPQPRAMTIRVQRFFDGYANKQDSVPVNAIGPTGGDSRLFPFFICLFHLAPDTLWRIREFACENIFKAIGQLDLLNGRSAMLNSEFCLGPFSSNLLET